LEKLLHSEALSKLISHHFSSNEIDTKTVITYNLLRPGLEQTNTTIIVLTPDQYPFIITPIIQILKPFTCTLNGNYKYIAYYSSITGNSYPPESYIIALVPEFYHNVNISWTLNNSLPISNVQLLLQENTDIIPIRTQRELELTEHFLQFHYSQIEQVDP
jgi:hypothetical protein